MMNPVKEFILQSEQNLRIAIAVSEAWPEARRDIADRFIRQLESDLRPRLKGWIFEHYRLHPERERLSFYFYKPDWKGPLPGAGSDEQPQYYVNLEFGGGQATIFGLARNERISRIGASTFSPAALAAVGKAITGTRVRAKKWWEAMATLQAPGDDWSDVAILWRMHQDPEFRKEVARQLLDVARACEAVVDRLVRSK